MEVTSKLFLSPVCFLFVEAIPRRICSEWGSAVRKGPRGIADCLERVLLLSRQRFDIFIPLVAEFPAAFLLEDA